MKLMLEAREEKKYYKQILNDDREVKAYKIKQC